MRGWQWRGWGWVWGEAGGAGGLRKVCRGLEDALNYRLIISGD